MSDADRSHRGAPDLGDTRCELRSAFESCIVTDGSDAGRMRGTGDDLLDLLNRLSTGKVDAILPGEGTMTVLTSPKGRIVERLFVHRLERSEVLLVGSPRSAKRVMDHLDRYTFAERTGLVDVTDSTRMFAVIGPRGSEAVERAGLPVPGRLRSERATLGTRHADVLGQDGLSPEGFSVVVDVRDSTTMWERLRDGATRAGGCAAGREAAEASRVLRGLPAGDHELNEGHNPLEAGLIDAVSFDKGCYVGQEVVARLKSRDKVVRALWGVELDPGEAPPPAGSAVIIDGRPAGELTSSLIPPGWDHPVGLAYVKCDFASAGRDCRIDAERGSVGGRLVRLPFGYDARRSDDRSQGDLA